MKKILVLTLFFVSLLSHSQTVEVFNFNNNVREGTPDFIIDEENKIIKFTKVNYNVKEISPSFIIEDNKVYEVKNNYKNIFPIKEFVVKDNNNILSNNYNMIINHSSYKGSSTDFIKEYVKGL